MLRIEIPSPLHGSHRWLVALCALGALASLIMPSRAAAGVENGLIAYSVQRDCTELGVCNYFTYTVRPNGKGRRQLRCSRGSRRECRDALPRFSPRGRVLATGTESLTAYGDFLTLRRPSGPLIRTIQPVPGPSDFAWSPSGRRFAINIGGIIAFRGLRSRRVTRLRRTDEGQDVAWSQQGRLAWSEGYSGALIVSDKRRRRFRRLKLRAVASLPRWSPDGRRLVFLGTFGGAYTVRPDGSRLRLVLEACGGSNLRALEGFGGVVWSPDGTSIACANRFGDLIVRNLATRRTRTIVRNADPFSLDWQHLPSR